MNKRTRSLLLLVAGVLLWIGGGVVILFSQVLAIQLVGIALFAAGPMLVYAAGRLLRSGK